MTVSPDDFEWKLSEPAEEASKPLAPDEPFRPDMILVPLTCSACRLRMYAQKKHIGLWTSCPDCGRLNEIKPVEPQFQQVVAVSSTGTFQLRPLLNAVPDPVRRYNTDYRQVSGSVDEGNEKLPFYGLKESSDDEFENLMDHLIDNKVKNTQNIKKNQVKTIKKAIPSALQTQSEADKKTDFNHVIQKNSKDSENDKLIDEIQKAVARVDSRKNTAVQVKRNEGFFAPFLDSSQFRRFGLLALFGLAAFTIFFTLDFYITAAFSPSSNTNYSFILFFSLYMAAALPMVLWGTMLMLCGMTIFAASREGFGKIDRWIPFRLEFALQYLFWLLVVSWTAPFPGAITGLAIAFTDFGLQIFGSGPMAVNCLGTISLFLFGPAVFLSIVENDRGFDIFHRRIWKSLYLRFGTWLWFYGTAFLLLLLLGACAGGGIYLLHITCGYQYAAVWPVHIGLGIGLSLAVESVFLIGFRLIGCLAYRLNAE